MASQCLQGHLTRFVTLRLYPLTPKSDKYLILLKYHPLIKHEGCKNKGNDHKLKKLLIVNSPGKYHWKCIESRMENVYNGVRVRMVIMTQQIL